MKMLFLFIDFHIAFISRFPARPLDDPLTQREMENRLLQHFTGALFLDFPPSPLVSFPFFLGAGLRRCLGAD